MAERKAAPAADIARSPILSCVSELERVVCDDIAHTFPSKSTSKHLFRFSFLLLLLKACRNGHSREKYVCVYIYIYSWREIEGAAPSNSE